MSDHHSPARTLALHGGEPARLEPLPPMFPGGTMIGQEEEQSVIDTIRSQNLFRYYSPHDTPSKVKQFEARFAAHAGIEYTAAMTSCTAALTCALRAIGIGPGDEVLIPAYTWVATASAVVAVGGIPIIVEVDDSLTIDVADIEPKITPYTRAIIAVHMRGAPCDMPAVLTVARRHGLKVIEDTAQAMGGSLHGRSLGTFGDIGCFSFQLNKIITAGEGGMVVTNDKELWKRVVMFHDPISASANDISLDETMWGVNYRMPELLAAVLLVQLERLDDILDRMRGSKRLIRDWLGANAAAFGITLRHLHDEDGDTGIAVVMYMDSAEKAQQVAEALAAENIQTGNLYHPDRHDLHVYAHWTPIMQQRAWSPDGGPWRWAKQDIEYTRDMCPNTLDWLGRSVHVDISPLLTGQDCEEIIDGLDKVLTHYA